MTDSSKLLVRWPKVLLPVIITAVFGVVSPAACAGLLYGRLALDAFSDVGPIGFWFIILVLAFFTFLSIGGFFSSLRNLKEPYKRLEADENGILFYVNPRKNEVLLVPWNDIEEIKRNNISRGDHRSVETLNVALLSGSSISFPGGMMNAEKTTEKSLNYGMDTLDMDLDALIKALNDMKEEAKR